MRIRGWCCPWLLVFAIAKVAAAQTPFAHAGADALHPGSSVLPDEQVDPASGSLLVVATDLVLPGNAGFDLRIQRVYNSAVYPDYASGSTALEEDSWAGIGWKLHFGRIINPDATGAGQTLVEMGDGSRHALYHSSANPFVWTTSDFWIYDRAAHTLKLPNGLVYTFDRAVTINARLGTVRYVTEIRDPFNNRITFSYFDSNGPPDGVAAIDQYLDAGQSRHVTFTYDSTLKGLSSMTYLGHTWTYTQQASGPAGFSVLRTVQPPAGRSWQYDYTGMVGELTGLTTPAGGHLTYAYADAVRRAGSLSMTTRVVRSRSTSGPSVTSGAWTYDYGTGTNQDTTVVTCPCGMQRYRFDGTGVSADFTGWRAGTLLEHTVEELDGTVRERQTYTWARGEPISNDPLPGTGGVWSDDGVYRPLLTQAVTTRGSQQYPQTWTTIYGYNVGEGTYNDYGRPRYIEARGETIYQKRTTSLNYQYGFAPYLVLGRLANQYTQVQWAYGQTSSQIYNFWNYEGGTGFLTGQSVNGGSTSFERSPSGNVTAAIDGRGNRTTYGYSWGRVASQQTPKLLTTFVVSPEGLVTGETTGPYTTTYGFDGGFRPSSVSPPGATPVSYTYDDVTGLTARVTRGSAFTESTTDGFGAVVTTLDQVGVKTRTTRDACGRATFTSTPYTSGTGTIGATTEYDALGRVTRVTSATGDVTIYGYNGVDVWRTDGEGRVTAFDYMAFGGPGDQRLVGVTDASNTTTQYEYGTLNNLTKVTGPSAGLTRTWDERGPGQTSIYTQPESGTTSYTRDLAGNITQQTDATGAVTTFTYDEDNRLVSRDAPGTIDDLSIAYDAGSGLVTSLTGGGAVTVYSYDAAGRIATRSDTIAGQSYASSYTFDGNDNLTLAHYPSGRDVAYEYSSDRLSTVRQNGAVFASGFTYDDAGRPSGYTTGAVTHTFTFDADGRTSRILSSGAGGALDLTYGYDRAGNVRTIADSRPNASQSFGLDVLNRLTTANGPWGSFSWTYDAAGNRLSETGAAVTTYTYDAATQRLMSTGGARAESFGYDAAGRLTSDAFGTYTYSPLGRLATTANTGISASYLYDPAGLRVSKTVNGATTYTIRSASGDTLSEYTAPCGPAVWARDLIYAGGRLLGAVKAVAQNPTVSMTAATRSVAESGGSLAISFTLTTASGAPLACAVTASYRTVDGTAAAPADYGARTGTLTFAAGTASGSTQTVSIPISNDPLNEGDETFAVDLSSVAGGSIGATGRTTVTIADDDPIPTLTIADASLAEGNSGSTNLTFTVSLSAASGRSVQVQYATANSSATAGVDYVAASGTLSIPAGTSSTSLTLSVLGDGRYEPDETFVVNLSAPLNATLARTQATGTILNDDAFHLTWGDFVTPLDGAADAAVFSPTSGMWTFRDASTGATRTWGPWGGYGDVPVPADYTGDGVTDCAVYRPSAAVWFISPSCGGAESSTQWGAAGIDIPAPGDYDGDGKIDIAVFRPTDNNWYIIRSSTGAGISVLWGQSWTTSLPAPGDYDGDGITDLAYYTVYDGVWWVQRSSGGTYNVGWGQPQQTIIPTPGDYDGDGKTDLAYFYPANGTWYIVPSTTGVGYSVPYGGADYTPVPADYDGDRKTDIAVYHRPTRSLWITLSATGTSTGLALSDVVPSSYDIPILRRPFGMTSNPQMSIDGPAHGATVTRPFTISGWAIDVNAPTGTGVDAIHVWACANANPQQCTFVAAATYGTSRPDIATAYGDAQFTNSGYSLTITSGLLAPGYYTLQVYAHSQVVNAFTLMRSINVMVQ